MKGTQSSAHANDRPARRAPAGDSSAGYYATEAAAQLICGHRSLLRSSGLPGRLHPVRPRRRRAIRLDRLGRHPRVRRSERRCRRSEARILRLAAELAEIDTGVPLDDLLAGLDDTNARLVLDAITHALTHGGRR